MDQRRGAARTIGTVLVGGGLLLAGVPWVATTVARAQETCAASQPLDFEMDYIDTSRAGGEPILALNADGRLLWGSHAGTTHFYSPEAPSPATAPFVENYTGQTYYYYTEDGTSWEFVLRQGPADSGDLAPIAGVPASGFSDPEFAVDQAGNIYVSEINLANVAVSKSTDGGTSYAIQNVFAFTSSDRQWMAADRENELYMSANGFGGGSFPASPAGNLGHFMAKSTDGGVTFGAASTTNPNGVGDIQMDWERGILYELSISQDGSVVSMARFPNVRNEDSDFTVEIFDIAAGVGMSGVQRLIDPTFALDGAGNLYVTWYDNGTGSNAQGVYFAASTDQGETWSDPLRIDPDERADIWPWIAVGDPGHVVVSWLGTEEPAGGPLPGETAGDNAPWTVYTAHTSSALGCQTSDTPTFTISTASSEPVHTGTICQHGTVCQTDLTDRRLGDYFSVIVAGDGGVNIAVSDTRQGGAVALPLHIRQTGGPLLRGAAPPSSSEPAPEPDDSAPPLPATGGGLALAGLGIALLVVSRRTITQT